MNVCYASMVMPGQMGFLTDAICGSARDFRHLCTSLSVNSLGSGTSIESKVEPADEPHRVT